MDVAGAGRGALTAAAAGLAATSGYLLALLLVATRARHRSVGAPGPVASLRFAILVPAHDEEPVIRATLDALAALDGSPEDREVIVVADHCTDRTSEMAVAAGATVLERDDGARGKGAALAWALEWLGPRMDRFDAVLVVDADCAATPNLLAALSARLRDGVGAAQADYVVANPGESPASGLRYAAFRLVNTVRPLGKDAIGHSAGLNGTGMAFTRELLARVPWDAGTVVEDAEQHLAIVAAGDRVGFVADAAVISPMPTTLQAGEAQQERWESSRVALLRRWGPVLVRDAVRERDLVRAHAALELVLPPQSLLVTGAGAVAVVGARLRAGRARRLALAALAGQAAFVVGGLVLVRAPTAVWCALVHAPLLVAQKLRILTGLAIRGGPSTFVRTGRQPAVAQARRPPSR